MNFYDRIKQTAAFIQEKTGVTPTVGIILGSGLGTLTDIVNVTAELDYSGIPNFPASTVEGHCGKIVAGTLGGRQVVLMSGRFHYYEGYDMDTVTFPVRVMKALGVETLILSNAAGGMNPGFKVGDIMLITDHINLFPTHPLNGPNDERLGVRFPDMGRVYDSALLALAKDIAAQQGLDVKQGVYVGLQGPTFETPAEYRCLHRIGGDAVGMSTVPEAIVAVHGGMRVFAASVITDIGISDVPLHITHEEVLEAANAAAPKLAALVAALIAGYK